MPEPALNEANVRHLLRRTEFVDRNERVTELLALGSIANAVDNVLAVPANPPSVVFTRTENWERGEELTHFWLDRMAGGASRPFQERMALFWHGHFCSDLSKVNSALLMQQQIDLWRREGLGNIRSLAKTMSTQVAMIRYLDNNQNQMTSPNQNFARELMELFLLGVGNYSEADVEASTLAWTGHTDQWNEELTAYRWRNDWHDGRPKTYLGRTINTVNTTEADRRGHGFETIDVVLGNGIVPTTADNVANRGRPTRDVAAEFLSTKLWNGFATEGVPPAAVLTAMRTALVSNDFAVVPWVRAMLTHEGFYADSVKNGLVRTPVEYVVALLHATGMNSAVGNPDLADGCHGAASAVPAERERLASERLLDQRECHGGPGQNRTELQLGGHADVLERRRHRADRPPVRRPHQRPGDCPHGECSDVVECRLHRPAGGLHGHPPHCGVEGGVAPLRERRLGVGTQRRTAADDARPGTARGLTCSIPTSPPPMRSVT